MIDQTVGTLQVEQMENLGGVMLVRSGGGAAEKTWRIVGAVMAAALLLFSRQAPASPVEPLKIGLSIPMSGEAEQNGKELLLALQLWRDDVNAKHGLLGRPITLVYYDDQSNPAKVPAIYRKLINADQVHLLLGPYGTNLAPAVMRVLMEFNKTTISILAVGANRVFSYWRYFSMAPVGPDGAKAYSKGFFGLAAGQTPKPATLAIIAADAGLARNCADGAHENAVADGFKIVHEQSYPASTTDFAAVLRTAQATDADVVFVAALQSDSVGIVRAAKQIGLSPKIFGGAMLGLEPISAKARLGPALDGIVIVGNLAPQSIPHFPGAANVLERYRALAAGHPVDQFGFEVAPFAYAAGQILAQAVEGSGSLESDTLAEYMHEHKFDTVVGPIEYGRNGEWNEARTVVTQFQHVSDDSSDQFSDGKVQPILWPQQHKTGNLIYPYSSAQR